MFSVKERCPFCKTYNELFKDEKCYGCGRKTMVTWKERREKTNPFGYPTEPEETDEDEEDDA